MDIKILGVGCPRCKNLEKQVIDVLAKNEISVNVEKITDVKEMMKYGILSTPGLVVNEKLKCNGITPKDEQILAWIKEEMAQ